MRNDEKQISLQSRYVLSFAKFLLVGIFLLFQLSASAQERTISGTVTGTKNETMAGVTIVAKGTTVGAITDMNGKFTLSISASAKTLVISFMGMQTKEVEIGVSNLYDVVLSENVVGLDEVVVVGYGTQKKISVTGAIVSVSGSQLGKSPTNSVTNSLAGRVSGVATVQLTGLPGSSDPSIYIRGIGSLTASASVPLMLVDGVERSFTQMDPNEIESISVLKDASATAVYGIRGANGVVIVTTKRGLEGALKVSFSSSFGLQMPTYLPTLVDSYDYAIFANEAAESDGTPQVFSDLAVSSFKNQRYPVIYPNNNWSKMLIRSSAPQTQENINISGGSSLLKYFISFGYLNQDGLINTFNQPSTYNFGYKRYNYRMNLDLDMTKSTRFSVTIGGRSENRQSPRGIAGDIWNQFFRSTPFSGTFYQGKHYTEDAFYYPGASLTDGPTSMGWGQGKRNDLDNIMNLDIAVTQKIDFITKGLSWRFKSSNNSSYLHRKDRTTTRAYYTARFLCDVNPTAVGDSSIVALQNSADGLLQYSESTSKSRNWYLETALDYTRQFGPHHIAGLLLYNESKNPYPGGSFSDIPTGYVGIAARATYDYSSKYLAEINLGYNGSENFAPGKRFGFFPAVSVGWVATEENFLKNKISFLDYLKFRISYGLVGNDMQGSNRFLYLPDVYSASTGGYNFGTVVSILQPEAIEGKLGNPNVTWEKAGKQNYGIDLRFFKGKLGITADYFYELRKNILTTRNTIPLIFKMTLPALNLGKVQNHGYEGELKWRDQFGKVNYNLTTNISYAKNKILFMDEVPPVEPYLAKTNNSVGALFGYVYDGLWSTEDVKHLADFPNANMIVSPGDVRMKDLNGDNVITGLDQQIIGYPNYPEINYSVQGGADYKGFDISMLWNGVTNVSRWMYDNWNLPGSNISGILQWSFDNRWTPETQSTATAPRPTISNMQSNARLSSIWLRDASYFRLKQIQLGYTFSAAVLERLRISSLRVYANGYDLLTISKLKIFDPEQQTFGGVYPLIKIVNFGLTVNF